MVPSSGGQPQYICRQMLPSKMMNELCSWCDILRRRQVAHMENRGGREVGVRATAGARLWRCAVDSGIWLRRLWSMTFHGVGNRPGIMFSSSSGAMWEDVLKLKTPFATQKRRYHMKRRGLTVEPRLCKIASCKSLGS